MGYPIAFSNGTTRTSNVGYQAAEYERAWTSGSKTEMHQDAVYTSRKQLQ